jgi:BTB/POZ domain
MASSVEFTETLASTPFDDARADIVLRSSDGVYFRVFKIILSLASPIFTDMFSIALPASEELHAGCPVVALSEDSKSVDFTLRHLYPVKTPTDVKLPDVYALTEFARKYEVDALEPLVTRYLMDAIEDDPVGVYAIAITYGHKGVATLAACSTLKLPISCLLQSPYLHYVTAELYGKLIQYHTACGMAASAVASKRRWLPRWEENGKRSTSSQTTYLNCSSCATLDLIGGRTGQPLGQTITSKRRYGPWWLWDYLFRSMSVLIHQPIVEAVTTTDFALKSLNCPSCPPRTREDLLELTQVFGTEIRRAIEQVSTITFTPNPCWHYSKLIAVPCRFLYHSLTLTRTIRRQIQVEVLEQKSVCQCSVIGLGCTRVLKPF